MQVEVSGFPFFLQGFNGKYKPIHYSSQGNTFPFLFQYDDFVYHLEPYYLYGLFSIGGVYIIKREGRWVFVKEEDYFRNIFYQNECGEEAFIAQKSHSPENVLGEYHSSSPYSFTVLVSSSPLFHSSPSFPSEEEQKGGN